MTHHLRTYNIGGQGGGGKGGKGGGSGGGGSVAKNTLRSTQMAKVIDLISEGPIVGFANGLHDVFLDGVRVQNPDGTYNFKGATIVLEVGLPDQPVLPGFDQASSEAPVAVQVKTTGDVTRTINNPDVDQARVTVSVPSLQKANDEGDIKGTAVKFELYLQSNGGGFVSLGIQTISGMSSSRYQRSYIINLVGRPPWDIRIRRQTLDSTNVKLANDLYWDTLGSLINTPVNYNSSAVIGITVDASQFNNIPARAYRILGRILQIPDNYDPITRVYSGVWSGTFKQAWSNNPAWVLYDLLTHERYGLGHFISEDQVDIYALYALAKWADEPVDNGKGGTEPRWTFNGVLADRQEAYDLITALTSVLRANVFWGTNGLVTVSSDMPVDPVGQYTNASVVDGVFSYAGSDRRARHNYATVGWNNPESIGEARLAIVEDQDSVAAIGLQQTEIIAIGCTSEGQAIRTGKWTLFTEVYEADTVTFSVGLEGAWCRPGDVVKIADRVRSGMRRGGRLLGSSISAGVMRVELDAPAALVTPTEPAVLSCYVGTAGAVETRDIVNVIGNFVDVAPPFSTAPTVGSTYVVSSGALEPTLWRVVSVKENSGIYEISALTHHVGKWDWVERDIVISDPQDTIIGAVPEVTNLQAIDYLTEIDPVTVGAMMLVSWTSLAPFFDVVIRPVDGNPVTFTTTDTATTMPVTAQTYEIEVTPRDSLGRRGLTRNITHTVIGLTAPPETPTTFRIQVIGNVALFQWDPTPDLDVKVGGNFELRYSPVTTGVVVWDSTNPLIVSIPGSATSVEVAYRPGTYLLKAKDSSLLYSPNAAQIREDVPSSGYATFFRICESPTWPGMGGSTGVAIEPVNDWIILANTGGRWDDQLTDMDTWGDVDVLPFVLPGFDTSTKRYGVYRFAQNIDMGAKFATLLSVDMLAFPFLDGASTVDTRQGDVDTWQSWDDPGGNLTGKVYVQVRSTDDDPLIPTPNWSEWQEFISGQYNARAFQFRAVLEAPFGQNVAIETLCVIADVSAKTDQDPGGVHGVPWVPVAGVMHINFNILFYSQPSISILVHNSIAGEYETITNKTNLGFDLVLRDAAGNALSPALVRYIDWIATGY